MLLLTSISTTLENPLEKKVSLIDYGIKCVGGLLAVPRRVKQAVAVGYDLFSSILAVWVSFSLRLEHVHHPEGLQWIPYLIAPALMLPLFTYAGIYCAILSYGGFAVFIRFIKTAGVYGVLLFSVVKLLNLPEVPHSVAFLQPMIFLITTGGTRVLFRFFYNKGDYRQSNNSRGIPNRLLIYGAGSAGAEIANSIRRSAKYELAGYLDDDPQLHGRTINGMLVFSPDEAESLIERECIIRYYLCLGRRCRSF
ncbi:MAG: hypothetical protein HGB12_08815, partial [Bacteroidetes bacterium]|nr:hypothetical protein [Bacteroidota bacterium]